MANIRTKRRWRNRVFEAYTLLTYIDKNGARAQKTKAKIREFLDRHAYAIKESKKDIL